MSVPFSSTEYRISWDDKAKELWNISVSELLILWREDSELLLEEQISLIVSMKKKKATPESLFGSALPVPPSFTELRALMC